MPRIEDRLIEHILRRTREDSGGSVRLGIGDDTAVARAPAAGEELLLTTDQIIENTHFHKQNHPPGALGHKCLARGLSDLAAMGGRPLWFLLSLALPLWSLEGKWLKNYLEGMFRLSRTSKIRLIGGDIARADHFTSHVTAIGSAPRGRALTRSGAKPGDIVYVSGRLGGSALGFEQLEAGAGPRRRAVRRHLYPEARLELGRYLRARVRASAAMDLSDGLSTDLARLTKASGAGAEIQTARIPLFPGASAHQALHGGEEYELLFTAPAGTKVPPQRKGIPLTAIGRIVASPGVFSLLGGTRERLTPQGFEHFGPWRPA